MKLANKVYWVVRGSKEYEILTERVSPTIEMVRKREAHSKIQVSKNVKSLTKMFPATARKVQEQLAANDVVEIAPPGDTSQLQLLQTMAENADPLLHENVTKALQEGDLYVNNRLEGSARGLYGSDIAPGAQLPTNIGRIEYCNNVASDNARGQYGHRVGYGKSFMDD